MPAVPKENIDRVEVNNSDDGVEARSWLPYILSLFCLAALGLICFLPTAKHVGFYLDDWVMLNTLSNGPKAFWDLYISYFSNDPRVVKRPIEALHFVTKFCLFGDRPMGYHVVNLWMEISAAWILCLCLFRLTRDWFTSIAASAFFLMYPSHNSTHYWVVCGSVSLSQLLYLGSLLLNLEGAFRNRLSLHVAASFLIFVSLLNYEIFLPLTVLNILLVFLIRRSQGDFAGAFKSAAAVSGLFISAVLLLGFYVKVIVPKFASAAWIHAVTLDSGLMVETLSKGISLNLPWVAFPYFSKFFEFKLQSGLSASEIFLLGLAVTVVSLSLAIALKSGPESNAASESVLAAVGRIQLSGELRVSALLFIIGCMVVFLSYTIFGVNESYMPTFLTLVNRTNTGASIGVAFVVAAFLIAARYAFRSQNSKLLPAISILSVLPVMLYLIVVAWSMSRPYVLSWQLQSHIKNYVQSNKPKFKEVKHLLLINAPRYVDEAPLFDGVWDFQSMVRIVLERKDISCGVVGERFRFSQNRVQDVQAGLVLASYDFDDLYVLISPTCKLVKVESANELLDLVEHSGMQFEQDKTLVDRWTKEINENKNLESNRVKFIDKTFQ